MAHEIIVKVLAALLLILFIALIAALPTMWLWNYLMPYLFSLKTIGFFHALCLNTFCGILFKSSSSNSSK